MNELTMLNITSSWIWRWQSLW